MLLFDIDVVKINKVLRRDANQIIDLLHPLVFMPFAPVDIGKKLIELTVIKLHYVNELNLLQFAIFNN